MGKWFQQKTYYNLSFERDYRSYFPVATLVKKAGEWLSIPLNKVEPGDRLWIKNGELIPVDAVIVEGRGYLDYSFVTGEEDLSTKGVGDKVFVLNLFQYRHDRGAGHRVASERVEVPIALAERG